MGFTIPLVTPVEYLTRRKYPRMRFEDVLHLTDKEFSDEAPEKEQNIQKQANAYIVELQALPKEELNTLYERELEEEREEWRLRKVQEEQKLFFNQPEANADYDFWSRATYWKLDEAVALSFGKDPKVVIPSRTLTYVRSSDFAKKYSNLWELAQRAMTFKKLYEYNYPGVYIGWVRQNQIDFPKELEDLVVARGNHIVKWKGEYDKLFELNGKNVETANEMIAKRDENIKQLKIDLESAKSIKPIALEYTTPYLELMQKAIAANNISPDNQHKKDILKQWFLDNAPPELQMSDKKADMMATLIRLPESSVGGNKRPTKK